MRVVYTGDYIVGSATTITKRGDNQDRCFELNAVGLTESEAITEAARRNAVEQAAGHHNVHWFPSKNFRIEE